MKQNPITAAATKLAQTIDTANRADRELHKTVVEALQMVNNSAEAVLSGLTPFQARRRRGSHQRTNEVDDDDDIGGEDTEPLDQLD